MALLIALAYAAPQSPEEDEDTENYINVSFGIILVHYIYQAGGFF